MKWVLWIYMMVSKNFVVVNKKVMYSLDCSYYTKEFNSINELINDVIVSGMDPNYEITYCGKLTGEYAINFIQF